MLPASKASTHLSFIKISPVIINWGHKFCRISRQKEKKRKKERNGKKDHAPMHTFFKLNCNIMDVFL